MPTLNAYKNDPGYYIRAWTPDQGNINYKLYSDGNRIVEGYDLRDGDEISWPTIHSLKAVGAIYTDGSGTLGPDDFKPLDKSTKSLTQEEAEELLRTILDQVDPSEDEIEELCDILDIERPESREAELERELRSRIEEVGGITELDTDKSLNGEIENASMSVDVSDYTDDEESSVMYGISIFLLGDVELDHPGMARHDIRLCQEHGLEGWHFAHSGDDPWKVHAEMSSQKSVLLPVVLDWFDELGLQYGLPDEDFGTGETELYSG